MNVEPTAEIIESVANEFITSAKNLRFVAQQMRNTKDITYVAEATNLIRGVFSNVRLDLLITRPLREMQHQINSKGGQK